MHSTVGQRNEFDKEEVQARGIEEGGRGIGGIVGWKRRFEGHFYKLLIVGPGTSGSVFWFAQGEWRVEWMWLLQGLCESKV